MNESSTLLTLAVAALVGLAGYVVHLLKTVLEKTVETGATKATEETMRQRYWHEELHRELQKTRGAERQELRYESYGALWKELRPLAIYDATPVHRAMVGELSDRLTDWYFSVKGGLVLTPQARDFYFALQDLLRVTATRPEEWTADRSLGSERELRATFRRVLDDGKEDEAVRGSAEVFEYFARKDFDEWEGVAPAHGEAWRRGINRVAARWDGLDGRQRFAVLQQVGSILRSSLTNDVESRSR